MKEATVQVWVRNYLATEFGDKCIYMKYPAGQYSSRGVADLLFCIHGLFVAIEVKTETGTVTRLQEDFIRRAKLAGGLAYVVYGKDVSHMRSIINDIGHKVNRV